MTNRAVICIATTPHYQRGMGRLERALVELGGADIFARDSLAGLGCPTHAEVPYAFKAHALLEASTDGFRSLLWCDASILPIADMTPLWERIERDGYWMSKAGYSNYEWTADGAYPDLFADSLDLARFFNRQIPHVTATTFGLSMRHPVGRAFLAEYFRLASETKAFCGPWVNRDGPDFAASSSRHNPQRCYPCGPADVRGHRHDQTAASVIAWRLGMRLTCAPEVFAYKGGETADTILVADGNYE